MLHVIILALDCHSVTLILNEESKNLYMDSIAMNVNQKLSLCVIDTYIL